eukprot:TRINITY_DN7476_c0_g1_i3.p1 TRINITY_DN7476_c0_g1~~TRINITY_DN7476_c0_g1_i3.p1  ORF type:complete len:681 (+),score=99.36 TRINITY_DN7476_c0_g1_i3:149-2191(+)
MSDPHLKVESKLYSIVGRLSSEKSLGVITSSSTPTSPMPGFLPPASHTIRSKSVSTPPIPTRSPSFSFNKQTSNLNVVRRSPSPDAPRSNHSIGNGNIQLPPAVPSSRNPSAPSKNPWGVTGSVKSKVVRTDFYFHNTSDHTKSPFLDDLSSQGVYVVDSSSTPGKIYMMRSNVAKESSSDRINLSRRRLVSIPVFKGEEELKLLNLQENSIHRIEHLGSLPNLIFLDLYHNQIKEISNVSHLTNLRVLMLGRNLVKRIEGIESLQLDVLDLHSNQIERIECLSHMTELRVLNLAGNLLRNVTALQPLTNLVDLNIRRNLIEALQGVDNLSSIQRLFASSNKISTFRDIHSLQRLTSLAELSLDGNPISSFPNYGSYLRKNMNGLRVLDGKSIEYQSESSVSDSISQIADMSKFFTQSPQVGRRSISESDTDLHQRRELIYGEMIDCHVSNPQMTPEYENDVEGDSRKDILPKTHMGHIERRQVQDGMPDGLYITPYTVDSLDSLRITHTDSIVVRNVDFEDFVRMIPRLLKKVTKITSLHLFHNNLRSLIQLHSLVSLGLQELRIIDNPINYLMLFEPYAICRLENLTRLNGKDITSMQRDSMRHLFSSLDAVMSSSSSVYNEILEPKEVSRRLSEFEPIRVVSQVEAEDCRLRIHFPFPVCHFECKAYSLDHFNACTL